MTRYRRSRKTAKPTRRLDPTALRELVADGRTWTALGKVADNDGDGTYHARVTDQSGRLVDVAVEFQTHPAGDRVTARLSTLVGCNPARGVFCLPKLGEEWLLVMADGEVDQAVAGIPLAGGVLPAAAAQATETNLVVVGSEVIITNAAGGGEKPAARRDDSVEVTIPIGTVVVAATGAVLNTTPITLSGTIKTGSSVVKLK